MSSRADASDSDGSRLDGAHADFVSSLGRKVDDAQALLGALAREPSSRAARVELRRHLHALGAGARLLQLDAMATAIGEGLAVLDRGAHAGALDDEDRGRLARIIDGLPSLGWGSGAGTTHEGGRDSSVDDPADPIAALVVGGGALADALTEDGGGRGRAFECERTEDPTLALEIARAFGPDVVLIDADVPGASDLVEALLDDPMTEPVPIVVVGSFPAPEEPARFVALGVAKSLAKPAAPETIRRICDELVDVGGLRSAHVSFGEPTLEQLADRLADQLRRALLDRVDPRARSQRIALGSGTEVLGALWGAIARVQEVVVQRTRGAIRFGAGAPEGAVALAPWLQQDALASERAVGASRPAQRSGAEVRLSGRRVVVADDDPGVTWFISDLLRTAGCEVHEALDGLAALDLAFRIQPDLVVTDILMPGLDGFGLNRAIRRDIALRDTPVILLSWKEDLLQRVRELGAGAAAYMRKESDSRAILARVSEVLTPRARLEHRLQGDGEVRGRLDGLSPRWLLELVCAIRKDVRVALRDATSLYEIEIRGGVPRKATRTAADGGYMSGSRAMGSLLTVGAGRFVVSPSAAPVRGDLSGSLSEQLAQPVARARGALAATTGARMMDVERITFDDDVLRECLRATPDPARLLIGRLQEGASPREILLSGDVSPSLLEDVLGDLASRGAVKAVEGPGGDDLLPPAIEAALAVLRGDVKSRPPPEVRLGAAAAPTPTPAPVKPRPARSRPSVERAFEDEEEISYSVVPARPSVQNVATMTAGVAGEARASRPSSAGRASSSLEDALRREISERSQQDREGPSPEGGPPPIIEPGVLRRRSSNPPEPPLEDLPPDASVPGSSSEPSFEAGDVIPNPPSEPEMSASAPPPNAAPPPARAPSSPDAGPYLSPFALSRSLVPPASDAVPGSVEAHAEREAQLPPVRGEAPPSPPEPAAASAEEIDAAPIPLVTPAGPAPPLASLAPSPSPSLPAIEATPARSLDVTAPMPAVSSRTAKTLPPSRALRSVPVASYDTTAPLRLPDPPQAPVASNADAGEVPEASTKRPRRGLFVAIVLVIGLAGGAILKATGNDADPAPSRSERVAPSAPSAPSLATTSTSMSTSTSTSASTTTSTTTTTTTTTNVGDDVPPDAGVPLGYGLVQVVAADGARVRIDGAAVGKGPIVWSVAAPGYHEVRVDERGQDGGQERPQEPKQVIEVRAGKTTSVRLTPSP